MGAFFVSASEIPPHKNRPPDKTRRDAASIAASETVKNCRARSFSLRPKATEYSAEPPTPNSTYSELKIRVTGSTRLTAASASGPRILPTIIPSMTMLMDSAMVISMVGIKNLVNCWLTI